MMSPPAVDVPRVTTNGDCGGMGLAGAASPAIPTSAAIRAATHDVPRRHPDARPDPHEHEITAAQIQATFDADDAAENAENQAVLAPHMGDIVPPTVDEEDPFADLFEHMTGHDIEVAWDEWFDNLTGADIMAAAVEAGIERDYPRVPGVVVGVNPTQIRLMWSE
jgi:hypothetical protein